MKIAFIGLGNMGGGMAANLAKAGHEVRAFDLSEEALARAVERFSPNAWEELLATLLLQETVHDAVAEVVIRTLGRRGDLTAWWLLWAFVLGDVRPGCATRRFGSRRARVKRAGRRCRDADGRPAERSVGLDAPDGAHEVERALGAQEGRRLAGKHPHAHVGDIGHQQGGEEPELRPDVVADGTHRRVVDHHRLLTSAPVIPFCVGTCEYLATLSLMRDCA